MGKSAMRTAVANFLDPAYGSNITYLSKVYQALPKVADEADLFDLQPPGAGVGAVLYVFIEGHEERRVSVPAVYGTKLRAYTVGLLVIFKSDLPDTLSGQVAFDELIDSLTARIQSDPNAGDPGTVWQWGQGQGQRFDDPDLRFDYPVPKTLKGGVTLFQAVGRVFACEQLTA